MTDFSKEIEDRLKVAASVGVTAAIEELARALLQGGGTHSNHASSFTSSSPDTARPYSAPSYKSPGSDGTTGDVYISRSEASSGTFRYFLFHWYEQIVTIPAGVKDGQTLHFKGQGEPVDPGDPSKFGCRDLHINVRIR